MRCSSVVSTKDLPRDCAAANPENEKCAAGRIHHRDDQVKNLSHTEEEPVFFRREGWISKISLMRSAGQPSWKVKFATDF